MGDGPTGTHIHDKEMRLAGHDEDTNTHITDEDTNTQTHMILAASTEANPQRMMPPDVPGGVET